MASQPRKDAAISGHPQGTHGSAVNAQSGKEIVRCIKNDMEINYFSPLNLSDYAELYNVNPNYLSSLFYSETGINFIKHLTNIRVEKAKQYLRYTQFSMEKITEMVGYGDRCYFSRTFKEHSGVSPSQYRKDASVKTRLDQEEYVYVAAFKNDPIIIEQDMCGLSYFSQKYNVHAVLEAPDEYDREMAANLLRNVISRRPSGLMVCAHDDSFIPYINEAVDSGIPTITVDTDAPGSKRIATVSSNWQKIGEEMARTLAELVSYRGKVAVLDISHSYNMQIAYNAFCDVMEGHRDIVIVDRFNDMCSATLAESLTAQTLAAHPDLAGIAGFDSRSAIGACKALKKANLNRVVKVVSIDITSKHIDLLLDKSIDMLLGQKRSLFTYYGGCLLYECNHGNLAISRLVDFDRFTSIPTFIDTGCIRVTRDNVMQYLKG